MLIVVIEVKVVIFSEPWEDFDTFPLRIWVKTGHQ